MSKTLLILESPAKARKVQGFLSSDYIVKASVGHVRDLPEPKRMTDKEREKYGDYAIDTENNFAPLFKNNPDKSKVIKDLKASLAKCNELVLFTDDDAEGHSIAAHLIDVLKPTVPIYRAVSLEITEAGINNGLKNKQLVDVKKRTPADFWGAAASAQTRALWDRLYGYKSSPYVWRTIKPGTSSGRVQTPGLRLVVEREEKRLNFKSVSYYSVSGVFDGNQATLNEYKGQRIATGKDFDDEGNVTPNRLILTDDNIDEVLKDLNTKSYAVEGVDSKPYRRTPPAPFTTSTALQAIGNKTRLGSKQITGLLQRLYAEKGVITYIRTVSVVAAPEAITAARKTIEKTYGKAYLPPKARVYKDKKQDNSGHECIRPVVKGQAAFAKYSGSDKREQQVFDIIEKRMLASQSIDCTGTTWSFVAKAEGENTRFSGSETEIHELGWTKIYQDDSDN